MKLYHISERPDIEVFEPRPSPSHYEEIHGDVVFAVSERFLYNYLLPKDCPRVTFYANSGSSKEDIAAFMGSDNAGAVVVIESRWAETINQTTLYCYEFPADGFELLDENAGYYISYRAVVPISVRKLTDIKKELSDRNIALRFMPSLRDLAESVHRSSLSFSLIRMRNAR